MSPEYAAALAAHDAAIAAFNRVRDDYRAQRVGDDVFLAARKRYDEATKIFDAAYDMEAAA